MKSVRIWYACSILKAIIFDWHGVLDETKFEDLVYKLADLTNSKSEVILDSIKTKAKEYTQGGNPEDFWAYIKKVLHLDDKKLTEAKEYILQVIQNKSLWKRLPSLKNLYILAILSDCPTDKTEKIRESTNLDYFKKAHFSCELGLTKSNDDFFLNLVQELNLKPEECLYVDDTPKHIDTAKRLGFQVCLFSSTEDLEMCLN